DQPCIDDTRGVTTGPTERHAEYLVLTACFVPREVKAYTVTKKTRFKTGLEGTASLRLEACILNHRVLRVCRHTLCRSLCLICRYELVGIRVVSNGCHTHSDFGERKGTSRNVEDIRYYSTDRS